MLLLGGKETDDADPEVRLRQRETRAHTSGCSHPKQCSSVIPDVRAFALLLFRLCEGFGRNYSVRKQSWTSKNSRGKQIPRRPLQVCH